MGTTNGHELKISRKAAKGNREWTRIRRPTADEPAVVPQPRRSRGTMAGKLQIDADKGFPRGHSLPLRPLRPLCAAISIIRVNLFPSAVGLLIRVRSRFPFAALGEIFNSQPVAPKALRRRIHPPSYSRPFAVPIRGPHSRSLIRGRSLRASAPPLLAPCEYLAGRIQP
jgi:hypothetical protein